MLFTLMKMFVMVAMAASCCSKQIDFSTYCQLSRPVKKAITLPDCVRCYVCDGKNAVISRFCRSILNKTKCSILVSFQDWKGFNFANPTPTTVKQHSLPPHTPVVGNKVLTMAALEYICIGMASVALIVLIFTCVGYHVRNCKLKSRSSQYSAFVVFHPRYVDNDNDPRYTPFPTSQSTSRGRLNPFIRRTWHRYPQDNVEMEEEQTHVLWPPVNRHTATDQSGSENQTVANSDESTSNITLENDHSGCVDATAVAVLPVIDGLNITNAAGDDMDVSAVHV